MNALYTIPNPQPLMFTATIHQTAFLARALARCTGEVSYPEAVYPVLAFAGSDEVIGIETEAIPPRHWLLNPAQLHQARALASTAPERIYVTESGGSLRFHAESIPVIQPLSNAARIAPAEPRWDSPLASIVAQAKSVGSPVLRQGIASLQFSTDTLEYVLVEVLRDSTWISVVQDGMIKSRVEYPALSGFDLLKALPFDHFYLK